MQSMLRAASATSGLKESGLAGGFKSSRNETSDLCIQSAYSSSLLELTMEWSLHSARTLGSEAITSSSTLRRLVCIVSTFWECLFWPTLEFWTVISPDTDKLASSLFSILPPTRSGPRMDRATWKQSIKEEKGSGQRSICIRDSGLQIWGGHVLAIREYEWHKATWRKNHASIDSLSHFPKQFGLHICEIHRQTKKMPHKYEQLAYIRTCWETNLELLAFGSLHWLRKDIYQACSCYLYNSIWTTGMQYIEATAQGWIIHHVSATLLR